MPAPNLFTYATSELSQDAVLAWLLAWADPAHKVEPMHAVGSAFLRSLIGLADDEHVRTGTVTSVQVRQQAGRIDVRADVQLEEKSLAAVVPVYFTSHDAAALPAAVRGRWAVYERRDLLGVLTADAARDVRNDTLDDFRKHLTRIEVESAAYAAAAPGTWDAAAWRGYFTALTAELGARTPAGAAEPPSWNYVPNKAGGFWALWWGVSTVLDGWLYLQMEGHPTAEGRAASARLTFRVRCSHGEPVTRREFRAAWHRHISDAATAAGFGVSAPSRFGSGATMTVAVASDDGAWRGEPAQDAATLVAAWHVAAAAARTHS